MLVIQVENLDTHKTTARAFHRSPVHLGRNAMNDLALNQPFVSLWHAIVRFDDETIQFLDLGSTNGTTLDGKRLERNVAVPIQGGDLRIGSLRLSFSRDPRLAAEAEEARHMTAFRSLASLAGPAGGDKEAPPAATSLFTVSPELTRSTGGVVSGAPPAPEGRPEEAPPGREEEPAPMPAAEAAPPAAHGPPTPVAVARFPPRSPAVAPPAAPGPEAGEEDAAVRTIITRSPFAPGEAGLPRSKRAPTTAEDVVEQVLSPYKAYRGAWQVLYAGLVQKLLALPQRERVSALELLRAQMPGLVHEEQFRELARSMGADPSAGKIPPDVDRGGGRVSGGASPPSGSVDAEGVVTKLLRRLARAYLPGDTGFVAARDAERFLERIADVLETCGKAFVELRKGHGQFGEQMAVRTVDEETPLHRARDARQVLEYVLDWRAGDLSRVEELMRGFVDVMIHEVALLNGMREGVRGVLARLGPEAIERSTRVRFRPLRIYASWRQFIERHRGFMEDEQEMTAALFGPEFARAYASVVGGRSAQEPGRPAMAGARRSSREGAG